MRQFDHAAAAAARARQDSLTKPPGALGRLEELAVFMAGWQGCARPRIARAQALVFAGNHGICARGVNPFPAEVTAQMVRNFEAGGAAINQLCRLAGAGMRVIALDLDRPTADFTAGPAMSAAEVEAALTTGAEVAAQAAAEGADILLLGEMGIGNSTVAAAQAAHLCGGAAEEWVGLGTGAQGAVLEAKRAAVAEGLARHAAARSLRGALAAYGGREQAAICGAVLEARRLGLPVLLDGFICTAAAGLVVLDDPDGLAHCLVGHESTERGHAALTRHLGKAPVVALDMRLGEGTGAAVALMVLRAALACHDGMATFAEAGIGG